MTDREFDNYLTLLSSMLRLSAKQRRSISAELRDHLEQRVEELADQGVPRERAVSMALEEFGDATALAERFSTAAPAPRLRRLSWIAAVAAALGWLILYRGPQQPHVPPLQNTAVAQDPTAEGNTQTAFRSGENEQLGKLVSALERPISLDFVDTPLSEAISWFGEQIEAPTRLDRRALEDVAIPVDSPVTIALKNLSGRAALTMLLRDVGLTYQFRDGMIYVTTEEERESSLTTTVYPVADLAKSMSGTPDYDNLIGMLTLMVSPDSWEDVGGPGVIYGPYRGVFSVSQTDQVHRQVTQLIDSMRRLNLQSISPIDADESVWRDKFQKMLATPMTVDFVEIPLVELAAQLSDLVNLPILLDRKSLEDAVIASETPITFKVAGKLPLAQLLRAMLREHDLTYVLEDEVLKITTPDAASSLLETRLYPVHDMTTPSSEVPANELKEHYEEELSNLAQMLESNISPDSWYSVGGAGTVASYHQRPSLIVSQTHDAHEQIEQLLATLRKAKDSKFSSKNESDSHQQLRLVVYPVVGDVEKVTEAIQMYVSPESWQDAGEKESNQQKDVPSILTLPDTGRILIRHRSSVQRQIRVFLNSLYSPQAVDGSGGAEGGLGGGGGTSGGFF